MNDPMDTMAMNWPAFFGTLLYLSLVVGVFGTVSLFLFEKYLLGAVLGVLTMIGIAAMVGWVTA